MATNNEHPIVWDDEKIARLWDHYSRDPTASDMYFAKVYGAFVLRRSGLPARQPLRVLDFGCGTGGMWEQMKRARVRWHYTGVDFSADSVAKARQSFATDAGFDGAVHATTLPCALSSGIFDVVLVLEVVEHLSDERLNVTLVEINRLLKPGGRLIVSTPNAEDLGRESKYCPECGAIFHQWQHVRSWTPQSLQATISAHGFAQLASWCGHWDDHWLGGWIYNRAAGYWLGRRRDPHMLVTFTKPIVS